MAQRTLPARRYFGAFLLVVAVLYGLVFFTGDTRTPQLGLDLRGGTTVTLTAATPDGQAPDPTELEFVLVEKVGCPDLQLALVAKRLIESACDGSGGQQRQRGGGRGRPCKCRRSVDFLQLHRGKIRGERVS